MKNRAHVSFNEQKADSITFLANDDPKWNPRMVKIHDNHSKFICNQWSSDYSGIPTRYPVTIVTIFGTFKANGSCSK